MAFGLEPIGVELGQLAGRPRPPRLGGAGTCSLALSQGFAARGAGACSLALSQGFAGCEPTILRARVGTAGGARAKAQLARLAPRLQL